MSSNSSDGLREARVSNDGDGKPIGAAVFLTAEDLAVLGVDPARSDRVTISVESGRLRVRRTENGGGE